MTRSWPFAVHPEVYYPVRRRRPHDGGQPLSPCSFRLSTNPSARSPEICGGHVLHGRSAAKSPLFSRCHIGMEARPVAAAALAVLLLVALVVHEGQSNSGGVVLSQRGTLDPKVHQALLSLARHLEGELQGVEGVLSAVDASASSPSARGQALAASSTPTSQSAVPGGALRAPISRCELLQVHLRT